MRRRSTGAFRDNNIGSGRQFSSGEQLMISFRVLSFITAALMILSGCSDKCGDPREDGFWGGVSGVYGNCYDKRLEEKNNQLAAENRRAEELKVRARILDGQYEKIIEEIELHRKRMQHMADVPGMTEQGKKKAANFDKHFKGLREKVHTAQIGIKKEPNEAQSIQDREEFDRIERECRAAFDSAEALEKAVEAEENMNRITQ